VPILLATTGRFGAASRWSEMVKCVYCKEDIKKKSECLVAIPNRMFLSFPIKKRHFFPNTPYHKSCFIDEAKDIERYWKKHNSMPKMYQWGIKNQWSNALLTNPIGFFNFYSLLVLVFIVSLWYFLSTKSMSAWAFTAMTVALLSLTYLVYAKVNVYIRFERGLA
jgi:hypothetical protein